MWMGKDARSKAAQQEISPLSSPKTETEWGCFLPLRRPEQAR